MTDVSNPKTADDIAEELKSLIAYTHQCKSRIYAGENIDLSGMDEKTAAICRDIAQLSPTDAHSVAPLLRKLIDNLSAMETDLLS